MLKKYCSFVGISLTILCSIFVIDWYSSTVTANSWDSLSWSSLLQSWTNISIPKDYLLSSWIVEQPRISTWFFTIINPGLLKNLTIEQRRIMIMRTHMYMSAFVDTVYDMKERGLLSENDIQTLQNKVQLQYTRGCNNIDGKISIKQRYTNNTWTRNELIAINLHINVCFQSWFVKRLPTYISQVITHELWHLIYYFDDIAPFNFQSICREKGARKLACTKAAFITPYAMTNEEEDYAESFAAWYNNTFPTEIKNIYLKQKKQYFDTILKK